MGLEVRGVVALGRGAVRMREYGVFWVTVNVLFLHLRARQACSLTVLVFNTMCQSF